MDCLAGILQNINAGCDTVGVGGNEVKAWILNRSEVSFTYSTEGNVISAASMSSGAVAYTLTAILKAIDSGHDRVIEAGLPDRFTHYIAFSNYSFTSAEALNIDNIHDVVVIVESRDKTDDGDGVFRVYGAKYGLDVTSDTSRANTSKGVRSLELGTRADDTEPFSNYVFFNTDYATTLAAIEALES